MLRSLLRTSLFAVLLVGLGGPALAQYGQIRGTITDADTGETLPGVNVVIDGTSQGAATNLDGQYVIIGLRPDVYTVTFSFVGYQPVRVEDVRVRIDLSTTLDMQLREEAFEGEEIVVTAMRELVQRDLTATTAFVSADEIRALPVENFSQVIELQAGVVDGHFRGGRLGEVGFWVDGLPVQDVYDGGLALSIENDMVQEAQIVTGAFNAEYGQAMSGIVNVVTRDGTNDFEGSFTGFVGDYFTADTRLPTGQSVFPELDRFSATAVRNLEASLGGPILRDRLFFFASGRYFQNDGWIFGRDLFDFGDVIENPGTGAALIRTAPSGDSSAVSLNPYERASGQLKLTANIARGIRLSANAIASTEEYKDFDLSRFFFPRSQPTNRRDALSTYLKLTHALSGRTFYEIGITNNYTDFNRRLFEDAMDPRYRDLQFFDFRDPLRTSNFAVGGTDNGRFFRSTNTTLLKADIQSQVNQANLVKVGIEGRYHTMDYRDRTVVVLNEGEANREQFAVDNGTYRYNPWEFSAYAQNKLEIGDLVINAGLRFDYFNANAPVLADPSAPGVLEITTEGTQVVAPEGILTDAPARTQLSPRLGLAFPISEGGVFHVSYGWFFQRPAFERLYQNPYFRLGSGGSGLVGLLGNAGLEPEKTISGEIGLKQQLTASSAIEVTAYYRDIRNLTGTSLEPVTIRGTSIRYGQLANSDFGFVRGMILRYDQRIGQLFAGFNYTFQIARANSSDPSAAISAAAALGLDERLILPTNWDQRHTASMSLAYTEPRTDVGFGLIVNYGTGRPYTPTLFTTGGPQGPSRVLLNSEVRPAQLSVDLSATKSFRITGQHEIQLYSKVDNLFDARNEVEVFGETGSATYSLFRNVDLRSFQGDTAFLDRWYTRPGFFSQPRRVVFGLRYSF